MLGNLPPLCSAIIFFGLISIYVLLFTACFLFFQLIKYGFLKLRLNGLRKETSLFTAELARLSHSTPSSIWEDTTGDELEGDLENHLMEAAWRLGLSEARYQELISTLPKSGEPHLE